MNLLLLAPGLNTEAREAFLEAMSTSPKTAAIPVLPLTSALKVALLDELSANVSWRSLFEELLEQIRTSLVRVVAKAKALVVEDCSGEPRAVQPDNSITGQCKLSS